MLCLRSCRRGSQTDAERLPISMNPDQSALCLLGEFVATASLNPLDSTRKTVRNSVIDAFGCMLGGVRVPAVVATINALRSLGAGQGSAPVFGTRHRAPVHTAAMLNAMAGHALEFDDWEAPGNTHPSVVLLPALLAVTNSDTTGSDLLMAYLAGFEVIARLGEALNFEHYDAGWHSTATLGSLGATASVARLCGLSPIRTTHALSIAVSRAAGLTCQFGSDAKALQAGFAAENGVVCAALAAEGVTGNPDVLEHPRGMAALMSGVPTERIRVALEKLGDPLAVEQYGVLIKPWPSCGYTHRIMRCACDLGNAKIDTAAIRIIDLQLPDFHAAILPFRHPRDRSEALFSLPFVAAMGLRYGNLTLDDLAEQRWQEPDIVRLIDCVAIHPFKPSQPARNYDPLEPDRMRITLNEGRQMEAVCGAAPGTPENPLSDEDVVEKFRHNAGPIGDGSLEALLVWPETSGVLSLFERFGGSA